MYFLRSEKKLIKPGENFEKNICPACLFLMRFVLISYSQKVSSLKQQYNY